ncbi:MAG: lysophospholipid acyltransferase family protein [Desulfobacterales bacterium]|jgi:1-acyl-sn-glycerol-3-phosphate acyltransferase
MRKPRPGPGALDAADTDGDLRRPGGRCLRVVKTVWLAMWVSLATLLVFPPITLLSLFSRTGNSMFILARFWARIICGVAGVKIRTRGFDRIERGRSYVIIANHQSHFDGPALALGLSGLQFRWIAKRELLKIPLFGHCLHSSRNIFIDRSNRERAVASIQEGMRRLPAGVSVMCFAEGTRSPNGRIGHFKKGGFAAALDNGMPILPVTINGSRHVLPKGSAVFQSGTIELVVGQPIETHPYLPDRLDDLVADTRSMIAAQFMKPS